MLEEKRMSIEELYKEEVNLEFFTHKYDIAKNFERLQELQNKIDEALLSIEGYFPA